MEDHRKGLRALSEELRAALSRRGMAKGAAYEWFIRLATLRGFSARFPREGQGTIAGGPDALRALRRRRRELPGASSGLGALRSTASNGAVRRAAAILFDPARRALIDGLLAHPCALGWLHQYWVHHDKVKVAAAMRQKSGAKVAGDALIAATCLFTPEEHVRFLLQNSLGAMWLTARPRSGLREEWPHLIAPDMIRKAPVGRARDISIMDPACGAGNFLVEAMGMLFAMCREEHPGHDPGRLCGDLLARNLFGIDIDERAIRIARDQLSMRCLELGGRPAPASMRLVCARDEVGALRRPQGSRSRLDAMLCRRYHLVAMNPPFVGYRKLSPRLKEYLARHDPLAASDLAVAFLSRAHEMVEGGGLLAVVTPSSWTTSTQALKLRARMLEEGGPRLVVSLGQRVFETAPLLFVSLAVIERKRGAAGDVAVATATDGGLQRIAASARRVPLERLRRDPGHSFSPAAAVLPLIASSRFAKTGDFFTFADGVWTGDNARDTRAWDEVSKDDPEWMPASAGHGHCRWYGPVTRVIRASAGHRWPHLERREACLEYSRVAGGKLAARMVLTRSVPVAGVVSMFLREGVEDRRLDVLAMFNSRVGTLWLRALTSGLNFNPGYAARVPMPTDGFSNRVRGLVSNAVDLKREISHRGNEELRSRLYQVEREIDVEVAAAMGVREADLREVVLPRSTKRAIGRAGVRLRITTAGSSTPARTP